MSLANAVQYTAVSSGTGDFVVSAAVTGFRTPSSAGMVDGFIYSYRAESADLTQWEIGQGTWNVAGNKLVRTTVLANSAGGTSAINFTNPPFVGISLLTGEIRERLNQSRTLYVGASLGAPTISIATPAVATLTAHGLSAGDRVVFNVPRNTRVCSITVASPGVVTINGHGLVANQPVVFHSSKYLPSPLVRGVTYYVVGASITTNTFQVSATSGGAAINTVALGTTFAASTTVTTSAAHQLTVGQIINFAGTVGSGFTAGVDYWVVSTPSGTTFTAAASPTGAAISSSVASGGTMVQCGTHFSSTVGALPTGMTEGTTYFVQTAGLTANAFRFSTSFGGADINTSGTVTGAPVYNVWTGNDANNGLSQTRGGALFTFNAAVAIAQTYDIGNVGLNILACPGVHTDVCQINNPFLIGTGYIQIQGNNSGIASLASNYVINNASNGALQVNHPAAFVNFGGFRITGAGITTYAGVIYINIGMDWGPISGSHINTGGMSAYINNQGANSICTGGGLSFTQSNDVSFQANNVKAYFLDVPAFTGWFAYSSTNAVTQMAGAAHEGSCTVASAQWNVNTGGGLETQGASGTVLGNLAGSTTSPGWKN